MSVVQLRPKAPFLYGWCGTEFSFQTPRWCGSMAEQLICNQQVVGSTPTTSSKRGKIPEWPKGADCKSVGTAFGGSNPPLPTKKKTSLCGVFFYAGNRGFCAVYTARRVAPEPPVSVLDASLCVQARSLSLLYESTSFKKIAVSFFMLGIVDSARYTPRGALRLNHLFRCWTLRYACKHARSRSYTNPPLPTIKKP